MYVITSISITHMKETQHIAFGIKYVFSSVLQKGLKNVFDEAILAALEPPEPPKKKKCVLL